LKNVAEIADFTNHLEEFDEMLFSVHIYACDNCDFKFGVDQSLEQQCNLVCPLCRADTYMKYIWSGEMRRNGK